MTAMISTRVAVLLRLKSARAGIVRWVAELAGEEVSAVAFTELSGELRAGDRVLLNSTALDLQLGTGGDHFIMQRASADETGSAATLCREDGHILKMRYTPLQCRVLAAEEEASPFHALLASCDSLPATPVVCLGLHSQLLPVLGGILAHNPQARVVYMMTDCAALTMAYSNLVATLREQNFLASTVSSGQAFGGDFEAVNCYSGMITALVAGKADVIIAGQGPGNVGTGTPLGFGGIDQAQLLNAAASLAGRPLAVPRISFADTRARHNGISHHTITVLRRLTLARVAVTLPLLAEEDATLLQEQLAENEITQRHDTFLRDGLPGLRWCQQRQLPLRSMGRSEADDPAFFLAAAAAGKLAGEMLDKPAGK